MVAKVALVADGIKMWSYPSVLADPEPDYHSYDKDGAQRSIRRCAADYGHGPEQLEQLRSSREHQHVHGHNQEQGTSEFNRFLRSVAQQSGQYHDKRHFQAYREDREDHSSGRW
jgi:hypothetical protein